MQKVNYQKVALAMAAQMIRENEKGNVLDFEHACHTLKLTPRQRTSLQNRLRKLADNLEARAAKMTDAEPSTVDDGAEDAA